jgi:hypothetical protein
MSYKDKRKTRIRSDLEPGDLVVRRRGWFVPIAAEDVPKEGLYPWGVYMFGRIVRGRIVTEPKKKARHFFETKKRVVLKTK